MKSFVLLSVLVTMATASQYPQPSYHQQQELVNHFLPYSFGYTTADGMSRQEQGHDGVVSGSYSYTDPNGDLRQVKYTADAHGFRPEGDIGVDRRTAEAAAQLAAFAPKAPAHGAAYHAAPAAGHWAPSPAAHATGPAPFQSYNSFEKMIPAAPASHLPQWNHGGGYAPSAAHGPLPAGPVSSYQVDTPTHKIWVKY